MNHSVQASPPWFDLAQKLPSESSGHQKCLEPQQLPTSDLDLSDLGNPQPLLYENQHFSLDLTPRTGDGMDGYSSFATLVRQLKGSNISLLGIFGVAWAGTVGDNSLHRDKIH